MEYLLLVIGFICYLIFTRLGHIFHQIKLSNEHGVSELKESLSDIKDEIVMAKNELSNDINRFRKLSGAKDEHEDEYQYLSELEKAEERVKKEI